MAVPKRKTSKMKVRQRKAANRYKGVQVTYCKECNAPVKPHRLCLACGVYNGQQVIEINE